MPFCFHPLRSGSNGNSQFVQAGNTRVLIDAGLSAKAIRQSLAAIDVCADTLRAIVISHEHSDHIRGVGVLSKQLDLPVYATEATWAEMAFKPGIDGVALKNRRVFQAGQDFYIGDLAISPFSIPHDAADPVGFALHYGGCKICVATDVGHISAVWMRKLHGADLLLLESNHDPRLLQASLRYPAVLKRRILGKKGHLSNDDCGTAVIQLVQDGLRHVILGHLSDETNTPALALETVCAALAFQKIEPGQDIQVEIAPRECAGRFYTVG